jgi:hypothetical protein
MKIFPIVCGLGVLLFYIAAYHGLSGMRGAPPAAAVLSHREPSLQRMPLPKAPASQTSAVAVAVPTVEVVTESKASAPTTSAPSSSPPPPTLELDGSLTAALEAAVPAGKPKFVLATFGNLGVREQLANFVAYVRRTGAAHVVGAVDVGAFDMMRSLGSPTYKTPLAAQDYKLDGSNQHSSGSWKRFASMRTGEVAKIVHAGFTVLHTDCDVRARPRIATSPHASSRLHPTLCARTVQPRPASHSRRAALGA